MRSFISLVEKEINIFIIFLSVTPVISLRVAWYGSIIIKTRNSNQGVKITFLNKEDEKNVFINNLRLEDEEEENSRNKKCQ